MINGRTFSPYSFQVALLTPLMMAVCFEVHALLEELGYGDRLSRIASAPRSRLGDVSLWLRERISSSDETETSSTDAVGRATAIRFGDYGEWSTPATAPSPSASPRVSAALGSGGNSPPSSLRMSASKLDRSFSGSNLREESSGARQRRCRFAHAMDTGGTFKERQSAPAPLARQRTSSFRTDRKSEESGDSGRKSAAGKQGLRKTMMPPDTAKASPDANFQQHRRVDQAMPQPRSYLGKSAYMAGEAARAETCASSVSPPSPAPPPEVDELEAVLSVMRSHGRCYGDDTVSLTFQELCEELVKDDAPGAADGPTPQLLALIATLLRARLDGAIEYEKDDEGDDDDDGDATGADENDEQDAAKLLTRGIDDFVVIRAAIAVNRASIECRDEISAERNSGERNSGERMLVSKSFATKLHQDGRMSLAQLGLDVSASLAARSRRRSSFQSSFTARDADAKKQSEWRDKGISRPGRWTGRCSAGDNTRASPRPPPSVVDGLLVPGFSRAEAQSDQALRAEFRRGTVLAQPKPLPAPAALISPSSSCSASPTSSPLMLRPSKLARRSRSSSPSGSPTGSPLQRPVLVARLSPSSPRSASPTSSRSSSPTSSHLVARPVQLADDRPRSGSSLLTGATGYRQHV